jgi:hypothetical protein
MGLFDKIERKLEGAVNGAFARTFKGDVQPLEVASALQKEIDSEVRTLAKDRKLVPNDFTVHLSQHDYDRLMPYSRTLNAEMIPNLREYAGTRGYMFNGPINIAYVLDDSLKTGQFKISSSTMASIVEPDASRPVRRTAPLVLEVNGVRHPLTPPGFTIGRGTEADLRISDPGISRRHARITVEQHGDIQQITIEDLNSTNGIMVDGHKIKQAQLGDGSRIEMGSTRMLVHAPIGE